MKARLTPKDHGKQPLCHSCRFATHIRGSAESQERVFCSQIPGSGGWNTLVDGNVVPFPVYECSEYEHKLTMSRHQMEEIAYILEKTPKHIGFKPPKRRGEE